MARTAVIVYNPASGRPARRAARARRMASALERRGITVSVQATRAPGEATRLAREAVAARTDVVVGYGGDGTLNEVIQGLVGSETALAAWRGGTANLLACELGLPRSIEPLADAIFRGATRRIAVGRAIAEGEGSGARYFCVCAGIGLDASICRGVSPRLKRWTGELAYWVSGARYLIGGRPERFVVDVDGIRHETAFAVVGNASRYGGGLALTPYARLEDPWLDVFVARPRTRIVAYLLDLVACLRGCADRAGRIVVKAERIRVTPGDGAAWVEVDGELFARLPVSFESVPEALSVIVP